MIRECASEIKNRLMHFNGEEFAFYTNVIDSLIIDMEYFPVARSKTRKTWVEYEDSWGNERTYGREADT